MFSFKVHHSLSKSAERFIMALLTPISEKLDAIDTSFKAKLAEFKGVLEGVKAELADIKTRVVDQSELDAISAKADVIKTEIDNAKIADEPAPPEGEIVS